MKFLFLGDAHLCYRGPSSRTDVLFETQLNKMSQVLEIYKREECDFFVQAGDLFDNPRPPNIVMAAYIDLFKQAGVKIHAVLGQHDLSMHSLESVSRSAINVFRSAGILHVLSGDPVLIGDFAIYGASWGEEVPKAKYDRRSMLVLHKMIGSKPLYPGHDIIKPKAFLHNYKAFEVVLCGDYHYRFLDQEADRTIINCGAMTRMSVAVNDLELKPAVAIYDTTDRSTKFIELSVKPIDEVFLLDKSGAEDHKSTVLGFVEKLKESSGVTVSFRDNLRKFFELQQTPVEVQDVILATLEEVGSK